MKGFSFGAALAASSVLLGSALADVDPIVIKGSKFFYKTNGTQFYIKGVAYQQDYGGGGTAASSGSATTYTDPLANAASCKRDIPYLTALRTNTIRVYALDPTQNHDDCMNALAAAGIYVVADLSAPPSDSINRESPSWNDALYARYTAVVDNMAGYSNTLGFFAGNEVSNRLNNTAASAFVKAAVRDTKAYIKSKNYRSLGVGYASADDQEIRDPLQNYFNCGDQSEAIDFFGLNIYEWCGSGQTYTGSGYDKQTASFRNYSVPVFFAEYGCIDPRPRTFDDTPVLLGPDMQDVWSGGIVYQYFQQDNGYGLVSVSGNSVSTLSDYSVLSTQIAKATPSGVQANSYTPSNSPRACPATGASWSAIASPLPPQPNKSLCQCMYDSLNCVIKSTVQAKSYGDLFGTVCGLDNSACVGINTNTTNGGTFGAYSMCNATEQLAFVLNQYYLNRNGASDACSFGGSATLKAATSATGGCSAAIAQAGTNGAGTVTPAVTGGGSSGSGTKNAAMSYRASQSVIGTWQMPTLVVVGLLSGMGMVLL